jgi:chaperonin GroEL (HSP60 family)
MTASSGRNEGVIITSGTLQADNLAVGRNARITAFGAQASRALRDDGRDAVADALEVFLRQLAEHAGKVPDQASVIESTRVVSQELTRDHPNGLTVKGLLAAITDAVSTVSPLLTAAHALQAAVAAFL